MNKKEAEGLGRAGVQLYRMADVYNGDGAALRSLERGRMMKYEILARFKDDGDERGCGWRECGTALEAVMEELREAPADTRDAEEITAGDDGMVAAAYRLMDGVEIHVHKDGHDDYMVVRDSSYNLVVNPYGRITDYDAAVNLMDDEIREELHMEIAPCTDQEFFDAYCEAHESKFGEEWELAKENPVW